MVKNIDLREYDYDLPADRIAQLPAEERDKSKLLVFRNNKISADIFSNAADHISSGSLLVFNNTKVIRARLLFRKKTGATIEIMCLEPVLPADYESSFSSLEPVEWKCIIGNLKKWKNGSVELSYPHNGNEYILTAEKIRPGTDAFIIRFSWNSSGSSFAEVINSAGHLPLPPYIQREDTEEDNKRYQTVYSTIKGSVAAPTAGLHFTDNLFEKIRSKGIEKAEITLHVGAGTFQPFKSENIAGHEMHTEHFFVTAETLRTIISGEGRIIAVGTTSVRTLESLYWLGVKVINKSAVSGNGFNIGQWEPYTLDSSVSVTDSLKALLKIMTENGLASITASTAIIIVPGYNFKMINGIITNFHQPKSTLLLLISAWVGENWQKIYRFALDNEFRFLSYGDGSLLLK